MVDVSPLGDHADTTPEYLWYLKDALGSTGALANLAGEIAEGYVYTPYGETTILDEFNRPREVVAREAFYHDADFDGAIDGFDWVDLQTYVAAALSPHGRGELGAYPRLRAAAVAGTSSHRSQPHPVASAGRSQSPH